MHSIPSANDAPRSSTARVAFATVIGTTIEWYDFFIYGTAAGLVFSQLFFEPAGKSMGLVLAFATVGISFVFRPVGAFLAGHFGDRLGRKSMLVATLLMMGLSTSLIGLLPTYGTAGILAPILLVALRILQGISAGGEWGGAVLMAVEHAPADRRGRAGSFPQLGVPLGMVLAAGMTALMTGVVAPGDAYLEWGWRIPFLLSIVLVGVGYYVRRAVDESPVFTALTQRKERVKAPIATLLRRHWVLVVLAALVFAGNNAAGYMTTGGFVASYATDPDGPVGLGRTPVLVAMTGAAAVWAVTTYLGGYLADRIGRKRTYIVGYVCLMVTVVPVFFLVQSGSALLLFVGLAVFTIGLGLAYGPQSAWYAELFPASVRFSGVALAYALGAVLGGAFAPMIATALTAATGSVQSVSAYLMVMFVIALAATLSLRDRPGIDLTSEQEPPSVPAATMFGNAGSGREVRVAETV